MPPLYLLGRFDRVYAVKGLPNQVTRCSVASKNSLYVTFSTPAGLPDFAVLARSRDLQAQKAARLGSSDAIPRHATPE